jgi:type IV pilus assembly protein PilZ
MPLVRPAGLYIPDPGLIGAGETIYLLLRLPGESVGELCRVRVVWISHTPFSETLPAGIAVQFPMQARELISRIKTQIAIESSADSSGG